MTQNIIKCISELIPTVNKDWADVIGKKMQKEPGTIRAYARGERGIRSGHHLKVLKHLKNLSEENTAEIEKLTQHENPNYAFGKNRGLIARRTENKKGNCDDSF